MVEKDNRRAENHESILNFMRITKNLDDALSESVKATINQFLHNVKLEVREIALANNARITLQEIHQVQINQLRKCILDLTQCLEICTMAGIQ